MKRSLRPRHARRFAKLRFEVLESRRLLAATDVTLHVLTSNGDAELVFNGAQQLSGYEIDSPSGQLVPANWQTLASQGNSGWATLGSTANVIAEGNLSGSLSTSTTIDLGDIFKPGGTQDLTFKWSDANNNAFTPAVVFVSPPDLTIGKSHSGSFQQGDTADTYTIVVNNIGAGPTNGTVTVTDTIPAGLTPTAAAGTGWSTSISGSTVTATRSDVLAAGASYNNLTITVSVAPNATTVTNTAQVSGGGETNTANDTASDPTTITPAASDLTIAKSHSGTFKQGDTADNYSITVSNIGSLQTSGQVTVTDVLPAGLAAVSVAGAGWTTQINGSTITATRSDPLLAGASYTPLTVTVGVANNAATSISNTATVSGGGEINTANDSSTDVAAITQVADLSVSKSHSGSFRQGDTADTYSVTVHNAGTGPTNGTVTVTDVLPAGLTPTAASGTGWTTQISGSTVTATRSDVLTAGGSYPALTITASVASNAAANVTNTVSVAGGGEVVTNNDSASDPTTIAQAADLTIAKSHSGTFHQGDSGDTYTIAVTNAGQGATAGSVIVTDSLPTGLTPTAASGTGWTTSISGSTVTATRSDVLSAGVSYPALSITVNVATNAAANLTNTATVSGGGELNTANDSAGDATSITAMPDLTIAKSHSGTFKQGDTADTYTISVGNAGSAATSGTVTVTDVLPSGLTPTAVNGTGWTTSISGSTVTATRSDAINGGASYPALTVTVSVAANAAASVTNTATVAGGGEINTANDSSSDVTAITQVADLTISKSHSGSFHQGDQGDTYTITVANAGAGATNGTVTITDTLPAGLTPTAASGTGWTTSISGSTVTATRSSALAAGASYPALTVTVSVASNAANSVTNSATVSGGGEINTSNDSASDMTSITAAQASLAGFVYLDTANTGQRLISGTTAKPGIANVTVRLLSRNAQGNFVEVIGKSPVQTAADGSYSFTGLASGDYRIQVTPPTNLVDGKDTAGQIGGSSRGTVTQDQIEVQLNSGENGTEYNFAMQGIRASLISLRLFLASTPPVNQMLPQFVPSTTAASAAATVNLPSSSKPTAAGVSALFAQRSFLLLASGR